jgi:hypothetical protein
MAVDEIKAYRASDGKVFTAKHEANKHEEGIIIKDKINDIVEDGCWRGMSKDEIVKFIVENKDEIFTALSTRIH